jgi:hypothetical protein
MTSPLWLTIDWREADADIPEEQQEQFTEVLFRELNGFDEVEQVETGGGPSGARWRHGGGMALGHSHR